MRLFYNLAPDIDPETIPALGQLFELHDIYEDLKGSNIVNDNYAMPLVKFERIK